MQVWHATFLGRRRLPRELSGFELEAFFTFAVAERQAIVERRQPALNLGLALQTGFLRMTGRPLAAVGAVPPALWRHLGAQLAVTAPDLASLRVMYRRLSTFYEHQQLACEVLDFRGPTERRSAVRWSGRCVTDWRGRADRGRLLAFAHRWLVMVCRWRFRRYVASRRKSRVPAGERAWHSSSADFSPLIGPSS